MTAAPATPKIAIVHDWLVSQRGGENVLDAICELFPQAHLYTLIHVPGSVSANIARLKPRASLLQRLPQAEKRYRHFLPLMPWAIESFDMKAYDLILSSSHCVAKGVLKRPDAFHMSYVHAPMRYMWDRFDEYFAPGRYGAITRMAAHGFRKYLQAWDKKSATRVDHFLANSKFIAEKVAQYYAREAQVVYPFCELQEFTRPRAPTDQYLIVTALVPYKRVDLAIEAFNRMGKRLAIVGDGPDLERLKRAASKNVQFLGSLSRAEIAELYSKCRALVFPGVEDFGIVPLEAMAAGAPVVAFGAGGALETVTPSTGVYFYEHTVEGLIDAVERLESITPNETACRNQASKFTRARFQRAYLDELRKNAPARLLNDLQVKGA